MYNEEKNSRTAAAVRKKPYCPPDADSPGKTGRNASAAVTVTAGSFPARERSAGYNKRTPRVSYKGGRKPAA